MTTTYINREDWIVDEINELKKEIRSLDKWLDIDEGEEIRCKIEDMVENAYDRYEMIHDIKAAGFGDYLPLRFQ